MIDGPHIPDIFEWQLADVLTDERAMFILWVVKRLFCTRREDFLQEYQFEEHDLDDLLHRLEVMGFLQEDGSELVLTGAGEIAVSQLGEALPTEEKNTLARASEDIQARFQLPKERIYVESRLIEQLRRLGWDSPKERDPETPYLAAEGRATYRDVLLKESLRRTLREVNREEGKPDLTDQQIDEAITILERVQAAGRGLLEANREGMRLLVEGAYVSGTPNYLDGADRYLRFIDFEPRSKKNEFLALNQFRVELLGRETFIIPDVVLFVNGIPLVVIECKSPDLTDPIEAGVAQLQRYASQEEGVPALFHFNLFLISTCFYLAKVGTLGAASEDYQQWKDAYPIHQVALAGVLGISNANELSSQQILVAGMLSQENLLDLLRNFVLFRSESGRTVKLIARYQQFRAVQKAIHRLQTGEHKTAEHHDQRGGIIWHTQGSGKSLTMVFLIRKMRTLPDLSTFKIVVITDRLDLQDQLKQTMGLTGERIEAAGDIEHARGLLAQPGNNINFIMIQKAREDVQDEQEEDVPTIQERNPSSKILLIVDEAHRSHTSKLHANIMNALPNCAKIGFTGTPIMMSSQKPTEQIFGSFIDKYTILQSEQDGATLPILYEGYQPYAMVADTQQLDQSYVYLLQAMPHEVRRQIEMLYPKEQQVLEAQELIDAKARHILLHYAANILPNGFKAMIVASSRQAAVRYQAAIMQAQRQLVEALKQLDQTLLAMGPEERKLLPQELQMLLEAHSQLELLHHLECAAVISGEEKDPSEWHTWSDEPKRKDYIARFKLPLLPEEGRKSDPLALLCVQQMLLTGFDAPIVQGLYLDRRLARHNLLQAAARVNRIYPEKTHGLVVDYLGIARQLKEALVVYKAEEVQGAFVDIKDELVKLEVRHLRLRALFSEQGINISTINLKRDRATIDACLNLLKDRKLRADFEEKLKKFLESMDAVLPRPEALRYVHDVEVLGYINKCAANFLPEEQIAIKGTGKKIRKLIDDHITVLGIEQTVAPISITDADFESRVDQHISDETKASQMEHLARYYIKQHYEEDPEYYDRLSKRLDEILESLKERWSELVLTLRSYIGDLRKGRPADPTGLDPRTQLPFLDILEIEASKGSVRFAIPFTEVGIKRSLLTAEQRQDLAGLTVQLVEMIRPQLRRVDFWRGPLGERYLKADIIQFLDDQDIISPVERQNEVADRLTHLAKHLHRWLIA